MPLGFINRSLTSSLWWDVGFAGREHVAVGLSDRECPVVGQLECPVAFVDDVVVS